MKINGKHVSVDAPFVEGEDNGLLDVMSNTEVPMGDDALVLESLRDEISRVLLTLEERERQIVEAFFGINQQD